MKIIVISAQALRIIPVDIFPGESIEWVFLADLEGPVAGEDQAMGGKMEADLIVDLDFKLEERRVEWLSHLLPTPVMVNSVVRTLAEIGRPFIRINGWPGFLERAVHELVVPDLRTGERVADIYSRLGRDFRLVPDIPGMISARVVSAIINEAYFTLQAGVSTKEEIDTAMRLGTNYPFGPFEWGARIGLERVHGLLSVLGREESRYLPAEAMRDELEARR